MESYTTQTAYEAMRAWVAREGATQCVVVGDDGVRSCLYIREEDGNRCAIGGILTLEAAREAAVQNTAVDGLIADLEEDETPMFPLCYEQLHECEPLILRDLQFAHDKPRPSAESKKWELWQQEVLAEMDEIAGRNMLSVVG